VSREGAAQAGGSHVRQGWFEQPKFTARLDVHRVERYPSYSVLHLDLYSTQPQETLLTGLFGVSANSSDFAQFALLDPVGRKYYRSLREGGEDGQAFGTRIESSAHPGIAPSVRVQPNVRTPVEVFFPPLPAGTKQITVLTPGSTGEMTGIPVTDPGRPQAPPVKPDDSTDQGVKPKPGSTFTYPVTPPSGNTWSQVQDLHQTVQGPVQTTTSGGDEETLALRADVLFAFNSDKLSASAMRVLDGAVNQTRAEADPSKPPISIVGHTDSKGGDAFNMDLSLRRARTVQTYLASKLGGGYRYQASGKGETEPVAPNQTKDGADNPEGRARNRRVEIRYRVKSPGTPATGTATTAPGAGVVSPPARFRTGDGPVAGSASSPDERVNARIDVHPFYRDGAYMVGVLTLHNNRSTMLQATEYGLNFSGEKAVTGSPLGDIVAVTPDKSRYYIVARGNPDSTGNRSFVEGDLGYLDGGATDRVYLYYPAPPAATRTASLQIGNWGTVDNIPVE
jgi:outer membrane protein OmpA-like peptidoglycan-associated protein